MANGNQMTIVGNLTRDPELRFTQSGTAVANVGVAWNKFHGKDADPQETAMFYNVTIWDRQAENLVESCGKGDRVVIFGHLEHRTWETEDGDKRNAHEIVADEIAPSLRWATAEVTRNPKQNGDGPPPQGEPAPPAYDEDEEPF